MLSGERFRQSTSCLELIFSCRTAFFCKGFPHSRVMGRAGVGGLKLDWGRSRSYEPWAGLVKRCLFVLPQVAVHHVSSGRTLWSRYALVLHTAHYAVIFPFSKLILDLKGGSRDLWIFFLWSSPRNQLKNIFKSLYRKNYSIPYSVIRTCLCVSYNHDKQLHPQWEQIQDGNESTEWALLNTRNREIVRTKQPKERNYARGAERKSEPN